MSDEPKLLLIKELVDAAESNLKKAKSMIYELVGDDAKTSYAKKAEAIEQLEPAVGEEKVIEGIFDGDKMTDKEGENFPVPANYASKSKLVEGDILKLSINNLGSFVYKQIKPIERERRVGVLEQDPQSLQFFAVEDGKKWKLLTASVTYFKGESGDEVVFLTPSEGESRWAAVENVVRD